MTAERDAAGQITAYIERKGLGAFFRRVRARFVARSGTGARVAIQGDEERAALSGLFGKRVTWESVHLGKLEAVLQEGGLPCSSLREALEAYFGEPVVTREEKRAARAAAWEQVGRRMEEAAHRTDRPRELLGWIEARTSYLRGEWGRRGERLVRPVTVAMRAFALAREHPGIRLPVLANRVGEDPHVLDLQRAGQMSPAARYLRSILRYVHPDIEARGLPAAEEWAELLDAEDIFLDDISSNVVTSGLVGTPALVRAASEVGEVLAITGRNIEAWTRERIAAPGGAAYLVENPSAFSALHERLTDVGPERRPALICTSGHLSLAARRLLDRLVETGATLHYSGDFDLKGIGIARFLRERYRERLKLWCMDPETYVDVMDQDGGVPSTGAGQDGDLTRLEELIDAHGPVYQEALIPRLASSLLS